MNKKRKGFTLIELLAVIIVISVIALICIPVVLGLMNHFRKGAFTRSAENVLKSSNLYYSNSQMSLEVLRDIRFQCDNNECIADKLDNNGNPIKLNASGDMGEGYILITKEGLVEFGLSKYNFCAVKYKKDDYVKVFEDDCSNIDITNDQTPPQVTLSDVTTTNSIEVIVNAEDEESGIHGYQYSINDGEYTDITDKNRYVFEGLNSNTEYTINVKVYNGSYGKKIYDNENEIINEKGMTESKIILKTNIIDVPIITFQNIPDKSSNDYYKKQTAVVEYFNTNMTSPQYFLKTTRYGEGNIEAVSCTTNSTIDRPELCDGTSTKYLEPNVWYQVQGNVEITYDKTTHEIANIIAVAYDGITYGGGTTAILNKIDKEENIPTVVYTSGGKEYISDTWATNNSVLITMSPNGPGSEILKYQVTYDGTTFEDIKGNTLTIDKEGTTKVQIKAIDIFENVSELSEQYIIKIDKENPTITYNVSGGSYNENKTITVSANDANYSYMHVHVYKNKALIYNDGADSKSVNSTKLNTFDVILDSDGIWTIYAQAFDENGNIQNQSPNNGGGWYYQEYTIDTTEPVVTIGVSDSTTNSITLPYTATDNLGTINSKTCKYGTEYLKYTETGSINDKECVLNGLTKETKYYYQICATDALGNKGCAEGNSNSKTISAPVITESSTTPSTPINGYLKSQTLNVTYSSSNITSPTYYIMSERAGRSNVNVIESCGTGLEPGTCSAASTTTIVANTWYKVSGNISVTYDVTNATENQYLYGRTTDGKNISSATYPISKIDATAPTVSGTKTYATAKIYTDFDSQTVLSGSQSVPVRGSNLLALSTSKPYLVSFDYKTSSGTNQFDVDFHPDSLPQILPKATTTLQHYDWFTSSTNSDMESSYLRFFDDVQEDDESDILISNIKLLELTEKNSTWYSTDVAIVINGANDDYTGIDDNVYDADIKPYSFDGGKTWHKSNAKIITSTQTVNIAVRDKAGNVYYHEPLEVKIDKTAPTITADAYVFSETLNSEGYYDTGELISKYSSNEEGETIFDYNNTGITFRVNVSDNLSGIKSSKIYWTEGGNNSDPGKDFYEKGLGTFNDIGKQEYFAGAGYRRGRFVVIDNAGNETVYHVAVPIDKTKPSAPTIIKVAKEDWTIVDANAWHNYNIYFPVKHNSTNEQLVSGATDDLSGVNRYQISSDNKTWYELNSYNSNKAVYYTTTSTTRYYRTVDNVGNVSDSTSINVKIDKTAPTVSYNVAGGTYNTTKTVTVTANDTNFDNMTVHVYKDGNHVPTKSIHSTNNNIFDVILDSDGIWTIYVQVFDKAGNKQNQTPENNNGFYYQEYVIDTTRPTVAYSVAGGTYNTTKTVRVTGTDTNYSNMAVRVYKGNALDYSNFISSKSNDVINNGVFDVSLDSDGIYTIYTDIVDSAGNTENQNPNNGSWYYQTYIIDTQKPTITYNYAVQSTVNWYGGEYYMGCFNGGITPILTLADVGVSGLSPNNTIGIWKDGTWINNHVSLGNNQWQIPMTTEGRYIPHIYDLYDNAGNRSDYTRESDLGHLTVWDIDTSVPSMSISFNGYTPGNWTNGNISISLSGANTGCETTKNYYYSINDGNWVHFGTGDTATYNIVEDASYNIKFLVTDGWGRWGTQTGNYQILRDTTKPSAPKTIKVVNGDWTVVDANAWHNRNIYFPVKNNKTGEQLVSGATDDLSGVNRYQISSDNKTWYELNSYNSNKEVYYTKESTTRYYRTVDNAGNVSDSTSINIKIDTTTPTVTLKAVKSTAGTTVESGKWSNQTLKFTLTKGTTGGSGSKLYYCVDTTDECKPSTEAISGAAFTGKDEGTYYVRYKAVGGTGIESTIDSYTAKVDTSVPTLTVSIKDDNGATYFKENTAIVKIEDAEGGSGLTAGTYRIYYGWGSSSANTCDSMSTDNSIDIPVTAGATKATGTITIKGNNTGDYNIYVCNKDAAITDRAGNSRGKATRMSALMRLDNTAPSITIGEVTITENTITIPYTLTENHSGVSGTTCVYGTSTSYGNKGTVTQSSDKKSRTCTISGLTAGTTYYYKLTSTDVATNSSSKTGNATTEITDCHEIRYQCENSCAKDCNCDYARNHDSSYLINAYETYGKERAEYCNTVDLDTMGITFSECTWGYIENIAYGQCMSECQGPVQGCIASCVVGQNCTMNNEDYQPVITFGTPTTTDTKIEIPFTVTDSGGIKTVECAWSKNNTTFTSPKAGTISADGKKCIIEGVGSGTTWYARIEATDNYGYSSRKISEGATTFSPTIKFTTSSGANVIVDGNSAKITGASGAQLIFPSEGYSFNLSSDSTSGGFIGYYLNSDNTNPVKSFWKITDGSKYSLTDTSYVTPGAGYLHVAGGVTVTISNIKHGSTTISIVSGN